MLDHNAILHHSDEIADLGCDPEIMGDEDDGEAEPLAQLGQQFQHLRLHGNVERGDRLVGDQSWEATPDGKTVTFKLRKGVSSAVRRLISHFLIAK